MSLSAGQLLCPLGEWAALTGELLRRDHTVRLRVRGWSMHPAIRDGEVVRIAPIRNRRLCLGQVLLCLGAAGRPFVHRLVRRRWSEGQSLLCLASDCFPGPAEWIAARQVLGRVVAIERGGRRIPLDGPRGRLRGWTWMLLRPLRPFLGRLRQGIACILRPLEVRPHRGKRRSNVRTFER
ncbi:MAG: S24/S26 family peptidase [Chloroflexia bacterium]|nr:S24/S26 family peptidase [Chloroflexia bacterium]